MKKLHLLKSMLLLFALIVGSTSVWADTSTLTFTAKCSGSGTANDGVSWTVTSDADESSFDNTKGIHYGTGTAAVSYVQLVSESFAGNVTSVAVNTSNASSGSATVTVDVGGATFKYNSANSATSNATATTYTFTGEGSGIITVRASKTSAKNAIYVKSIVVTFTPSALPTCVAPTFSPVAGTYTSAQSVTLSSTTDDAAIYYTKGENPANPTTSSTLYEGTIAVNATTTIKAIAAKDGHNNSSVATATYTILGHAGTFENPFTVADARTAIDANAGCTTGVYATGIVSEIVTAFDSDKITFNISADGLTTSDQLQAYQCITGAADAAQIHPGDVVIVSGNLTKYSSTYEFSSGCQVQNIVHGGASIDANNKTIEADATSGEIDYIVYHPTAASLTAALTDGNWISNIVVDEENSKVTFATSANTGVQRTATITLSYEGADDKVVTITQKKCDYATMPFAFDGGRNDLEAAAGFTHSGLGSSDYGSSPKLKFDSAGDFVVLQVNEAIGSLSFDVKGNGSQQADWAGTFVVQTSTDNSTYTELASYTNLTSSTSTKTFNNIAASVRYIKWIYTTKTTGNVALGNIVVTKVPEPSDPVVSGSTVTLTTTANMAGWRTYNNNTDNKYSVDANTKVYYVSATGDNKVTLTEIDGGVPANTAVILHNSASTTITLTETDASIAAPGSNLLAVSTAGQNLGKVYRLGYKASDGVGFYTYTTTSAPAGIIYVASVSSANFLGFDFGDGGTTGISEIKKMRDGENETFYNLAGQRVNASHKGIVIVNGKKVVIK